MGHIDWGYLELLCPHGLFVGALGVSPPHFAEETLLPLGDHLFMGHHLLLWVTGTGEGRYTNRSFKGRVTRNSRGGLVAPVAAFHEGGAQEDCHCYGHRDSHGGWEEQRDSW